LLAAALAALALVVAGCGTSEPAPLAEPAGLDAGGQQWATIAAGLSAHQDPASRNVCTRGTASCIDAVVAEMKRRYGALAKACDHRAPFALMYLRVTEGVKEPHFHDASYLRHLDSLFARLYFQAFENWRSGRESSVPEAWAVAFAAARDRGVTALGDMMLGMNAHISRDLPYALADAGIRERDGRSAKVDFDSVNDLLGQVQGPMTAEESRLFDPSIRQFTSPLLGVFRSDLTSLIASWRTEAWYNARRLLAARSPAERRAVSDTIERAAAARARLVQTATSYPVVGGSTASRDRYCLTRGAGAQP
jgi:hypothetical protein